MTTDIYSGYGWGKTQAGTYGGIDGGAAAAHRQIRENAKVGSKHRSININ